MRRTWAVALLCCCAFAGALSESVTTASPAVDSNATTITPQTTTAAKIDILKSDLCQRCICDKNSLLLNCSYTQRMEPFSTDEWNTLQNGDIIFEKINLEHNKLTSVPKMPRYGVKNLYLAFNQIASIESSAFSNLESITELDLSHNNLTAKALQPIVFRGTYAPDEYQPLHNLHFLDLGSNELHSLDSDVFENLPHLETLILCKNTFQVLDVSASMAISGLLHLKTLDLSYMELKELPQKLLHSPRDLETLILTGNLLTEIPDDLELAINLKQLVLDENLIADFDGENIFPKLTNLEYLSISYLPELKKIGRGAFSNLQNLTTLIASDNPKLKSIDVNAFAKSTKNPLFFDYPNLKKLYLHHNNLTKLNSSLLDRWDKIEVIDLRFNSWACDCSNEWMIRNLLPQINASTPLLTNDVVCATLSPEPWKKQLLLDFADNLACKTEDDAPSDNLIVVAVVVGIAAGVLLTIAVIMVHRLAPYGWCSKRSTTGTALYNRASFNDDFHI